MPRASLRTASLLPLLVLLAACGASAGPASGPLPAAPLRLEVPLLIPVAGVLPGELRDSFRAPRSGGRTHHAIDIHAPRGTPVLAAADGTIVSLRRGGLGGIALHQVSSDGAARFYYAHLDRYAAGIREGLAVRQGEVIAYVGDTGNAASGDYHLHFSVTALSNPQRWWEGADVNPYTLLGGGAPGEEKRAREE